MSDSLTQASLEAECAVRNLTPGNFEQILADWKPDLVFVESAWQGYRDSWKYGIASYQDHADRTNEILRKLLAKARSLNIPAVFWNKEDGVHYPRFIDSARMFQYIWTVDADCLAKYKQDVPNALVVGTLPFPIQPKFHHLDVTGQRVKGVSSFIGSYGTHVHPRRRQWQDALFGVFARTGLDVYDRNSSRKSVNYRYPQVSGLRVLPKVSYQKTASLYKSYKFNLNVNTVEFSPTMYSRRLIEIIAVGGVAVTTPSLAASRLFADFCCVVGSKEEMEDVLHWSSGRYEEALSRAYDGASFIKERHTWTNRLELFEDCSLF